MPRTFHLRPKVEDDETGVQLVILRTARYNHDQGEIDFGEISIFVGPSFVITVRQGVASELHGARTRLQQHPKLLALGTNSVLWAILDQVIKGYAPVVAATPRGSPGPPAADRRARIRPRRRAMIGRPVLRATALARPVVEPPPTDTMRSTRCFEAMAVVSSASAAGTCGATS